MTDDVLALAAADASSLKASDDDFKRVANLAHQQVVLEGQVEDLEEALKEKKKELNRIRLEDLPEAMDAIHMTSFKLEDGTKVEVRNATSASIKEENRESAHDWLRSEGHGSLIKTTVTVFFPREEHELVPEFVSYVKGWNRATIEPEVKESVHAQTLGAWARRQIEDGASLPDELLGVFRGRKTTVKLGKR